MFEATNLAYFEIPLSGAGSRTGAFSGRLPLFNLPISPRGSSPVGPYGWSSTWQEARCPEKAGKPSVAWGLLWMMRLLRLGGCPEVSREDSDFRHFDS